MKRKGRIFLVDDDELILSMLSRTLAREGYAVHTETGGVDLPARIISWHPDVVLLDINLPGQSGLTTLEEVKGDAPQIEVIMLTADDTAGTAVRAMKQGARDYLLKPFDIDEVKIVIENALASVRLKNELDYLRKINSSRFDSAFIGVSKARRALQEKVERIAEAHVSTILITGESGVGKDVVARTIHRIIFGAEENATAPFIAVNCSALPDTLLESELFGYEKGAFTDARQSKKGLFELASGGTLLLDELGEMKLSLQSKLLRALEERVVRRIGGQQEIPVDVTVVATSNRDLAAAVERGEFRMDLFYRMNAFAVNVPPLRDRERKEDIVFLANHFLSVFAKEHHKPIERFSPEAEALMLAYRWPGNVRELKNMVRAIVVLQDTRVVMPEHLPLEVSRLAPPAGGGQEARFILPAAGVSLDRLERDLIRQALERADHNKAAAARLLGVSYDSFRYQLKKFGLE